MLLSKSEEYPVQKPSSYCQLLPPKTLFNKVATSHVFWSFSHSSVNGSISSANSRIGYKSTVLAFSPKSF